MKENLHEHMRLVDAMAAVQAARADEIGEHTWQLLVEHYGEAILFAEIASIVSRLEGIYWHSDPYSNPNDIKVLDRALDLCVDLGNYTEFLFQTVKSRRTSAVKHQALLDSAGKLSSKEASTDEEAR